MPEAMGILAQQLWVSLPKVSGTRTHVRGYGYSCTCAGSTDFSRHFFTLSTGKVDTIDATKLK